MKPKLVIYNSERGTLWFADKSEPYDLKEEQHWLYNGKMITKGWKITFSNGKVMDFALRYPLTIKNFEECPRFKHLIEEFELVNNNFEIIKTNTTGALLQLDQFKGMTKAFTNVEFIYDTRTKATIFVSLIS